MTNVYCCMCGLYGMAIDKQPEKRFEKFYQRLQKYNINTNWMNDIIVIKPDNSTSSIGYYDGYGNVIVNNKQYDVYSGEYLMAHYQCYRIINSLTNNIYDIYKYISPFCFRNTNENCIAKEKFKTIYGYSVIKHWKQYPNYVDLNGKFIIPTSYLDNPNNFTTYGLKNKNRIYKIFKSISRILMAKIKKLDKIKKQKQKFNVKQCIQDCSKKCKQLN